MELSPLRDSASPLTQSGWYVFEQLFALDSQPYLLNSGFLVNVVSWSHFLLSPVAYTPKEGDVP